MTPRNLLTVALRVLGLFLLITSLVALVHGLSVIWFYAREPFFQGQYSTAKFYQTLLAGPTLLLVLALVLLSLAPRLARWWHPDEEPAAPPAGLSIKGVLTVGVQLLGLLAIVLAIEPLTDGLFNLWENRNNAWVTLDDVGRRGLFRAGALMLAGLVLVFAARPIAARLCKSPSPKPEPPPAESGD